MAGAVYNDRLSPQSVLMTSKGYAWWEPAEQTSKDGGWLTMGYEGLRIPDELDRAVQRAEDLAGRTLVANPRVQTETLSSCWGR
jgi:hypothetical protein